MPSRPRFAPAGVDLERRADGSIVLRSPQPLAPPARAVGEWLVQWAGRAPDRTFLAERAGDGWRKLAYREVLDAARRVGQALLDRGLGPEQAGRDPLRQRRRPRPPRARRDARRRPGRAGVARLLADVEGLREAEGDLRAARARARVLLGPGALRAGARRGRRDRHPDRGAARRGAERARRRGVRPDRARHDREDPLHFRVDRHPQGRDQHPPHAVLEPADGGAGVAVPRGPPAGARRLAALEPHVRRQLLLQHGAAERRHAPHRRRQARAGARRDHRAEPQGDLADGVLQRPARLRPPAAVPRAGRGAPGELLPRRRVRLLRRRGAAAEPVGAAREGRRRGRRRAHAVLGVGLDRDRAARDRGALAHRSRRRGRRPGPRLRAEARPLRRQARGAFARAERDARLLPPRRR